MRVTSLCSSSKANSTYIEHGGEGILVDIGCSFKMLREGLERIERTVDDIKAVFITHEHSDHISGLMQLTKNLDIPVYASEGTLMRIVDEKKVFSDKNLHIVSELADAPVSFAVNAFRTSHDSAESMGYMFDTGSVRAAVCTDTGCVTDDMRAKLYGCRFVLLESNYDPVLLTRNIKYPPVLKTRIRSERGHLSNGDSAVFARELIKSGTVSLLLGHLSQENNTPDIAYNNMVNMLAMSGAQVNRDYMLDIAPVSGNGRRIIV